MIPGASGAKRRSPRRIVGMVLATPWHYWMGVAIALPAILMLLVTILLYVRNVSARRFPKS